MAKPSKDYLRYSGAAFQLLALILVGVWLGGKLDAWQANEKPIWTAVLSLVLMCVGMYQMYKEITR
jgi:F0F1-type ATP synthase assembly protein I